MIYSCLYSLCCLLSFIVLEYNNKTLQINPEDVRQFALKLIAIEWQSSYSNQDKWQWIVVTKMKKYRVVDMEKKFHQNKQSRQFAL